MLKSWPQRLRKWRPIKTCGAGQQSWEKKSALRTALARRRRSSEAGLTLHTKKEKPPGRVAFCVGRFGGRDADKPANLRLFWAGSKCPTQLQPHYNTPFN